MTEPRPVSALLHAPMVAIEAGTNRCVRIDVSGILAPGDRQAYVCNRCGKVTGWITAQAAPAGCAAGCTPGVLVFCGRFVPARAPSPDGVLSYTWRPELSAADVLHLVEALAAHVRNVLEVADSLSDGSPAARELAALTDLQKRLADLPGEIV